MRLNERQTRKGDDDDTGAVANDLFSKEPEIKRNRDGEQKTDKTNKTENTFQERKTKSTEASEKHEKESFTKSTNKERQTNKYMIGMKDKGDTNNNMLMELQRIDERSEIKLLQKVIEDSKERHKDTSQQTETSKNIADIPEKNGTRSESVV